MCRLAGKMAMSRAIRPQAAGTWKRGTRSRPPRAISQKPLT